MRVPLSWLRDFAPFDGDPVDLAATLDDLGLVVEGIERIGEGLGDVVVVRVDEIAPIDGADRIRRVVVDDGSGPIEVVCGAWNFDVGDLVPLAPVGAVLPGGFAIGKRKMKGVVSNGMLCSGRELRLSEDHEGILGLNDVEGAAPGSPLVDGPRDRARRGVRRRRRGQPARRLVHGRGRPGPGRPAGPALRRTASHRVPGHGHGWPTGRGRRPTWRSRHGRRPRALPPLHRPGPDRRRGGAIAGVAGPTADCWPGMRPINNVVDASNYVMLELGQPTHPYDLDRLPGHGLVGPAGRPGETVTTLDGVERTLGRPGPGLGDTGQDCLICDAEGRAGRHRRGHGWRLLGDRPRRPPGPARGGVLRPMAIARTSKRLALRTEASARFERGCDPAGIDRAADRFCELLALTAGPTLTVADGVIDVVGDLPGAGGAHRPARPRSTPCSARRSPPPRWPVCSARSGHRGDGCRRRRRTRTPCCRGHRAHLPSRHPPGPDGRGRHRRGGGPDLRLRPHRPAHAVVAPARPAHRPPAGAPVAEGGPLRTGGQRGLDGRPSSREADQVAVGRRRALHRGHQSAGGDGAVPADVDGRGVWCVPCVYNVERRQGDVRLFEVGSVFRLGGDRRGYGAGRCGRPSTSERLSAVLAAEGDDAWTAVAAWRTVAEALGLASWSMADLGVAGPEASAAHRYRSSAVVAVHPGPDGSDRAGPLVVGVVGELDPTVVGRVRPGRHRRTTPAGRMARPRPRRSCSTGQRTVRRPELARPLSRFPSSDIDLAFVVPDEVPAGSVERDAAPTPGAISWSRCELFDVYRGSPLAEGARSLAFHLRFCALDRTLTDEEIGVLRAGCIEAVTGEHQASLR